RHLEKLLGFGQIAAKDKELAKGIVYSCDMNVVFLESDVERSFYHLLGLCPLADQQQVKTEVVVGDNRIECVLGLIKKLDRFFETRNPILRTAEKPICSGHVGVQFAEHE